MARKHTVFLTGATGTLGSKVLEELTSHSDTFNTVVLVRPTKKNRSTMARHQGNRSVKIVWGDLTEYDDVAACVAWCDVVAHCAAMIPPAADEHPEVAKRTNTTAMRNIIRAVLAKPADRQPAIVNIGSIAETGDRNPPIHWGRVGDPIKMSAFDAYGVSKAIAERDLAMSRVRRWTTLRCTGIFYPELVSALDPLAFHTPLGGVLEWISDADAARLVAAASAPDAPAKLWGRAFNIGGGESWRLTNYDFTQELLGRLGGDIRNWYRREWFITRNFHGQWYTDSHELQHMFHYWGEPFDVQVDAAMASLPAAMKKAGSMPAFVMRDIVFAALNRSPRAPSRWLKDDDTEKITAYLGSRAEQEALPDWGHYEVPAPSRVPRKLDHGYDESIPEGGWTEAMVADAARFRGGRLLGTGTRVARDPAGFACHRDHEFALTPHLVLKGGFWCPTCLEDWRSYEELAKASEFFAQVYPTQGA